MLEAIFSFGFLLLMVAGMVMGMLPIAREAKEEVKEIFKK